MLRARALTLAYDAGHGVGFVQAIDPDDLEQKDVESSGFNRLRLKHSSTMIGPW